MIRFGFSGHFRLEVYKAGTRNLQRVREFDNLITNAGLNSYGLGIGRNLGKCWVGTGTATPTVNDNALSAPLASVGMPHYLNGPNYGQNNFTGVAPDYVSSSLLIVRFGVGATTGNLTEIGLSSEANPGDNNWYLWCRALIVDENGKPTALPVLENEYLEVRYTLRVHPFLGDVPFTFKVDNEEYQAVARMANIKSAFPSACWSEFNVGTGSKFERVYNSNTLGTVEQVIQGATQDAYYNDLGQQYEFEPYIMGSYQRDMTFSIGLDQCNLEGGIKGITIGDRGVGNNSIIGSQYRYMTQISLDHPIMKENTNTMKFTIRTSWGRYEEP